MRSTCSGVASRSCTIRSASSVNGRLQRLTRKPGPSAASITCLPSASPSERARASASGELAAPATSSTSRIFGTGLKKCSPTTRSGRGTPAAIALTSSDEVLVASSASGATISASAPNSERLTSSDSGTASITASQRARCASSSAHSIPSTRSRAAGSGSWMSTGSPASRAVVAIPAPIVPAPTIPSTEAYLMGPWRSPCSAG